MKLPLFIILAGFALSSCFSGKTQHLGWISQKQKNYTLLYSTKDSKNRKTYGKLLKTGIDSVQLFFDAPFRNSFDVVIHPDRHSLDSCWQKDWGMPNFKSECWMVASGIATKLDLISPRRWDTEACEHVYAEMEKTQQLITHELVHVFHGQRNESPDFSNVEGMDWFVEGLATYVSGQCDGERIGEVKKAVEAGKAPKSLDDFWTGSLKYGMSGSLVQYIDQHYGRSTLTRLLAIRKKAELLAALGTSEVPLLMEWEKHIQSL